MIKFEITYDLLWLESYRLHIPGAYQAAVHAMKIAKQYNCTIEQEPDRSRVRTYFVCEEEDYIMLKLARPELIKRVL